MIRTDREITDLSEIESILNNAMVCRIGMADAGEPYIVPVCFGYMDGKIYLHSAMSGKKITLLENTPGATLKLTSVTASYLVSSRVHRRCDTKV
jgi:hypothetical protein